MGVVYKAEDIKLTFASATGTEGALTTGVESQVKRHSLICSDR